MVMAVIVPMLMLMLVLVSVAAVSSAGGMFMLVVVMLVLVIVREVHIKFHAADASLVTTRKMQVIAIEVELGQFAFQLGCIDAQIHQRANKHIAADTAKEVQIQGVHNTAGGVSYSPEARALI